MLEDAIRDAMEILKGMPCGGIGEDGPTLEELLRYAERGEVYEDANYHTAQEAWRTLEKALIGLSKGENT